MTSTDEPRSERTTAGVILWTVTGLIGAIYLLNPSAGVLELIPDNLPVVGNLDEAAATLLALAALKYLTGIDLTGRGRGLLGKKKSARKP
jgi:uncharacterized membrane protein YkvA (DUF1232 family)